MGLNAILERTVTDRIDEIRAVCRRHGVASLDLFGSGATPEWQPGRSDIDLLVTFKADGRSLADRFLGLADDLETLFGASVELLTPDSIRNPYLLDAIQATRVSIYAE